MSVDTLSRRALLEAKQTGHYAPRYRVWPPEGYVAPTAEEFAGLRRAAHGYATGLTYRSVWERLSDDQVLRRAQLCELVGSLRGSAERQVYDYARALRDELRRRKVAFRSLAVLRCESCSHASERLFEATQTTHPGMENRSGTAVTSAWYCARCWSGADADDEAEDEEC